MKCPNKISIMIEVPPARIPEEPGAVIPHAAICEGGRRPTDVPTLIYQDIMRLLILFAVAVGICSCSTRPAEVNSLSDLARINGELPRTKAIVFVHLPASIQTLDGKVTINGQFVAELPKSSFTKLTLSPGIHTIDLKFPAITGPNCEDFTFMFQKDTVYHLALMDGPRTPSLGALAVDEFLYRAAHLRPVHAFDGIELSRYEKYVAASQH